MRAARGRVMARLAYEERVAAYDGGRGGWAGSPEFTLGVRWSLIVGTWVRPPGRRASPGLDRFAGRLVMLVLLSETGLKGRARVLPSVQKFLQ